MKTGFINSVMQGTKKFLGACGRALMSPRLGMFVVFALCAVATFAVDGTAGTAAFDSVTTDIKTYLPYVQDVCYAIAGIVAIGGAISVYIKMNNEEQDVKKSIMMIVGACIFLIAAAQALPLFFGYE